MAMVAGLSGAGGLVVGPPGWSGVAAGRRPNISLVVPVFNEAPAIEAFVGAVRDVFARLNAGLEIVFVDDGSTDGTATVLSHLCLRVPGLVVVRLSRNFGKEAAMTAGLDYCTGDAVVPIDVDLQDPPEVIGDFLEVWSRGIDVVYGVRRQRQESLLKRVTAGLFYRGFNAIAVRPIPVDAGDYRLMDRRVVDALRSLKERNRFMKGLFAWAGFRSESVVFDRPARALGVTKFNLSRLISLAMDGVVGFSTLPLKVSSGLGVLVAFAAVAMMMFIVISALVYGNPVAGYPSLMAVLLFLGSVQLMSLGVIGEYLSRMVSEVKERPTYVVEAVAASEVATKVTPALTRS